MKSLFFFYRELAIAVADRLAEGFAPFFAFRLAPISSILNVSLVSEDVPLLYELVVEFNLFIVLHE